VGNLISLFCIPYLVHVASSNLGAGCKDFNFLIFLLTNGNYFIDYSRFEKKRMQEPNDYIHRCLRWCRGLGSVQVCAKVLGVSFASKQSGRINIEGCASLSSCFMGGANCISSIIKVVGSQELRDRWYDVDAVLLVTTDSLSFLFTGRRDLIWFTVEF